MKYSDWAARLIRHFFGPQFDDQRVRLLVTREILDENFPELGGTAGFLKAVNNGPEWFGDSSKTLRDRAKRLYLDWESAYARSSCYPIQLAKLQDAPPFLPYLCVLCLAWTEGDENISSGNAFYYRLDHLCPLHDMRGHLGEWQPMWLGLQHWTERLEGKWGRFVVETLGAMAHVGIPKSQVIFTPSKLEKLPNLYAACNLSPNAKVSPEQMQKLLRARSSVALQVLGPRLWEEIEARSELGLATLALLIEYLDNWDGLVPRTKILAASGSTAASEIQLLRLVLQPKKDNTIWFLCYGVEGDDNCSGVLIPRLNRQLVSVDSRLALLADKEGDLVCATQDSSRWIGGFSLDGIRQDDLESETELSLECAAGNVRLFDARWIGSRLVETDSLPDSGGIYILVGPTSKSDWDAWWKITKNEAMLQDFTWGGLPERWQLFYIDHLESISQDTLRAFPDGLGKQQRPNQIVRFSGGTRANTSAARRVYTAYDPPQLIVLSSANTQLTITGATAIEINANSLPQSLPGNTIRSFRLEINPDAGVVLVEVHRNGTELGTASFGVWRDSDILHPHIDDKSQDFLNRYGVLSGETGARGCFGPDAAWPWIPEERAARADAHWSDSTTRTEAFDVLESLHLSGRRLSFPDFKRRAMDIAKMDAWQVNQELRLLCQLGHVELGTDSRGRWSHVYPNSLQLYLLPSRNASEWQSVICGCALKTEWNKVIATALNLGLKVDLTKSHYSLLPPRVRLCHDEVEAFQLLAEAHKMSFQNCPPAYSLAQWSANLEDWMEKSGVPWSDGEGPRPIEQYIPEHFAILPQIRPAPYRLNVMEDTYTRRHRWFTFYDNGGTHRETERHSFLRDFTWALWKLQNSAADDEKTLLPFDPKSRFLAIPRQLLLPVLLGRSLALSSGLPPTLEKGYCAYNDRRLGILPQESPLYNGYSFLYHEVPIEVAKLVASKLEAEIVIINPKSETNE